MNSVGQRISFVAMMAALVLFAASFAEAANTVVRAAYKAGLALEEQPPGTVLGDAAACLPTGQAAARYDYKTRLAETVAKARTRMAAHILAEKSGGYKRSISALDENAAMLDGTLRRINKVEGFAYIMPSGELVKHTLPGTKFEGKCAKLPAAEKMGHPDAYGVLIPAFDVPEFFVGASAATVKTLDEELPEMLKRLAAIDGGKLPQKQKEERIGALAEEVMKKVGNFILIHPDAAAEANPRLYGAGGSRIKYTPSITTSPTGKPCKYVAKDAALFVDVTVAGQIFALTVSTPGFSHTFEQCIPEKYALPQLRSALE